MTAKKSQEREERARAVAQRQKEEQRKENRVKFITWGTIGLVIASIVVAAIVVLSQAAEETERVRQAAEEPIDGVQEVELPEPAHVPNLPEPEPVDGAILPTPGGPHDPAWQNCGVYTEPVHTRHAVHSLEHGAVWIKYHPDQVDDSAVQTLTNKVSNRAHTLLSPFPDLAAPIVVSAWGLQLELNQADDERIDVFLAKYVQGPQTPEPGAACSGAVSATR
ncbi:MAG: DUF3105 domain-containing protein [Demequina sp.]